MIILVGDIHGNWAGIRRTIEARDLRDCTIIQVGDLGVGFSSRHVEIGNLLKRNEYFKERGITFLAIRGNHDDPYYFDGDVGMYSNCKLLKDYTVLEIEGQKWQFIGGAISIDRWRRREGVDYWSEEPADLREDLIVENVDVLVTHTAPYFMVSHMSTYMLDSCYAEDSTLRQDIEKEREVMNKIYEKAKPKAFYCGHFHCSYYESSSNSRILNIDEFYEHKSVN